MANHVMQHGAFSLCLRGPCLVLLVPTGEQACQVVMHHCVLAAHCTQFLLHKFRMWVLRDLERTGRHSVQHFKLLRMPLGIMLRRGFCPGISTMFAFVLGGWLFVLLFPWTF